MLCFLSFHFYVFFKKAAYVLQTKLKRGALLYRDYCLYVTNVATPVLGIVPFTATQIMFGKQNCFPWIDFPAGYGLMQPPAAPATESYIVRGEMLISCSRWFIERPQEHTHTKFFLRCSKVVWPCRKDKVRTCAPGDAHIDRTGLFS